MIKFMKLHPKAAIPTRATEGSAGFDLTVDTLQYDPVYDVIKVGTGVACEIPAGYVGQLVVRSSTYKKGLQLANQIGIIDSDYRGQLFIVLKDNGLSPINRDGRLLTGDKVAQLVVVPCLTESEEVTNLEDTIRGQGGFGSTGV